MPTNLHGELYLRTAQALDTTSVAVSPALSVEFFRAFGVTRVALLTESPSHCPVDTSALILAGDQFLALSFKHLTQSDLHPPVLTDGVSRLISTASSITETQFHNTPSQMDVEIRSGELALLLAGVLTGRSQETCTRLTRIGGLLGSVIGNQYHASDKSIRQRAPTTQPSGRPHVTVDGEPPIKPEPADYIDTVDSTELLKQAHIDLASIFGSIPSPVAVYLDRLADGV